jgi:Zn-finger protein
VKSYYPIQFHHRNQMFSFYPISPLLDASRSRRTRLQGDGGRLRPPNQCSCWYSHYHYQL